MPSTSIANTFLIGAQKSGTTYLAAMLSRHPSICVSDPKEPHFLSQHFDEGLEAYARCFRDPSAPIRLDASTSYTLLRPARDLDRDGAPGILEPIPERINDIAPDAKLIYVMRDPVARTISARLHQLRNVASPPPRESLADVLRTDPMLVLGGRYADQIDRYLEIFPRDRFLFLDFETLTRDPGTVLASVFGFLGVSSDGLSTDIPESERNVAQRLSLLGLTLAKMPSVKTAGSRILPGKVRQFAKHHLLRRPAAKIEFTHLEEAETFFADDRARLPALTGLTI